jgi:hypothetical protein
MSEDVYKTDSSPSPTVNNLKQLIGIIVVHLAAAAGDLDEI